MGCKNNIIGWIAEQSDIGEGQEERETGENHRFSAVPMHKQILAKISLKEN